MNYQCISHSFWSEVLGLCLTRNIWLDPRLYIALVAAPFLLTTGIVLFPDAVPVLDFSWMALLLMVFWQPIIEELFFRGVLHGQLLRLTFFSHEYMGITVTNLIVSALFTVAHLYVHACSWALAVLVPSLIFGWFRDQDSSIYPPIVLHSFYNAVLLAFVSYVLV